MAYSLFTFNILLVLRSNIVIRLNMLCNLNIYNRVYYTEGTKQICTVLTYAD